VPSELERLGTAWVSTADRLLPAQPCLWNKRKMWFLRSRIARDTNTAAHLSDTNSRCHCWHGVGLSENMVPGNPKLKLDFLYQNWCHLQDGMPHFQIQPYIIYLPLLSNVFMSLPQKSSV
jgi:hypothetical protein